MHIMWKSIVGASLLLTLAHAAIAAGDQPDVEAGRSLAQHWCAECHDIRPGGRNSPNEMAPPFAELMADPSVTEIAFRALLRSPHVTMPQIMFTPDQLDDITIYVFSLKGGKSK
jgi:mono/diheme cytochrome c family protein